MQVVRRIPSASKIRKKHKKRRDIYRVFFDMACIRVQTHRVRIWTFFLKWS